MQRALIDADILTYCAGFASQTTIVDEAGQTHIQPYPIKMALDTVKLMLTNIINDTKCKTYKLFLTETNDHTNFRHKIAVTKPYKGNRAKRTRPYHYATIRNYLINQHYATVCIGEEADDQLGIEQCADREHSIICSIDKDLKMIPGWHYHIRKKTTNFISENEAWANFYRQLLIGDSVDNISGCPGIGPKKAEKLITADMNVQEMHHVVTTKYQEQYGTDALNKLQENGALLWIRRQANEIWSATCP